MTTPDPGTAADAADDDGPCPVCGGNGCPGCLPDPTRSGRDPHPLTTRPR